MNLIILLFFNSRYNTIKWYSKIISMYHLIKKHYTHFQLIIIIEQVVIGIECGCRARAARHTHKVINRVYAKPLGICLYSRI